MTGGDAEFCRDGVGVDMSFGFAVQDVDGIDDGIACGSDVADRSPAAAVAVSLDDACGFELGEFAANGACIGVEPSGNDIGWDVIACIAEIDKEIAVDG